MLGNRHQLNVRKAELADVARQRRREKQAQIADVFRLGFAPTIPAAPARLRTTVTAQQFGGDAVQPGQGAVIDEFDLAEAKELGELVKKTGLLYGLTHNYTGYPLVKQARAMVRDGALVGFARFLEQSDREIILRGEQA